MQIDIIPTDRHYHAIIDAPDAQTRRDLFRERFVTPWAQMMQMTAGMLGGAGEPDEFAGARNWAWLLPDDLTAVPETLTALEGADAWTVAADALGRADEAFAPYADRMPIDRVEGWIVLADAARMDRIARGFTGATDWTAPRFVVQYSDVNAANLTSLPGAVVHETHHLIRLRLFPWGPHTTVADTIVHEGMAESFATALFGEQVLGYYVSEFDHTRLEAARATLRDGLGKTGFDVLRAYVFGDHWAEKLGLPKVGMPDYGGYALGYRVVQAFLQRTGRSVAEATFLPAEQIVRESGYFD
jgi:uncharacterized protein YjaZ